MVSFILKRMLLGIPVLGGVALAVFFIFHVLPGDPVALMAGQRADVATKEAISEEFGLHLPLSVRLVNYLNDLSPVSIHTDSPENAAKYHYRELIDFGDKVLVLKVPYLGRSFQSGKRVTEMIAENLSGTIVLALAAMLIAVALGIPFGIFACLKRGTWVDGAILNLSVFGISVPSFVSAVFVAVLFGFYWSDFTGLGMTGQLWEYDPFEGRELMLQNLILPAFTLGIRPLAVITQMTRSSMIDVMSQDYIRTAKAKGLSLIGIVRKHALKNALNPVATAVSGWLASLMAGAFFVEYVFNWKGIGLLTVNAVETLDFPVVMGATLTVACIFIVVNILTDLFYALSDPRVKVS